MKKLEEIKELLIVVDMINGFVKEGALADTYIEHIVPKLEKYVKEFTSDAEKEVAFIRDAHSEGCMEFKKFPVHCLEGSYESELIDELKQYEMMGTTYLKNSRSFMFAPGFMNDLEKMKSLRKIIVTGCCTDLCDLDGALPLVNYLDQVNRNVEVEVHEDMVETYDAPWHNREEFNEAALKLMKQEGIKVIGGNL